MPAVQGSTVAVVRLSLVTVAAGERIAVFGDYDVDGATLFVLVWLLT